LISGYKSKKYYFTDVKKISKFANLNLIIIPYLTLKNNFNQITMFKTNEYFDGKVKSIALEAAEGKATIGVMASGEYEFGTSTVEIMTVISGTLSILMPGDKDWKVYKKFESFVVPKDSRFKVKATEDTPYLCLYK
jgi:purine/pyrimidine-nucleoside phosphorylase